MSNRIVGVSYGVFLSLLALTWRGWPQDELPHERTPRTADTAWRSSGNGSVRMVSGALLLWTNQESVTKVVDALEHRTPSPTFELSFRGRVLEYGGEQGVVLYDGHHRLMVYFRRSGVAVRTSDGLVPMVHRWSLPERDRPHDYHVVVAPHGMAKLFVDGRFVVSWEMQEHTRPSELQFWVKGPGVAALEVANVELRISSSHARA